MKEERSISYLSKENKIKVPKFKNVKEECKFWDDHESTDYLDDFEETIDVVFFRPKNRLSLCGWNLRL